MGMLTNGGELGEEAFGLEAEEAPADGEGAAEMELEAEAAEEEAPAKRQAVKQEALAARKAAPKPLQKVIEGRSDYELFVERKRTEGTVRDTACKAICKIKHALRQPGAQEDGRPAMPENWETLYKPVLGSFIKFLLSRPDQFRIIEGSGPGFYTIEDVTMSKTVTAPVKGKDKGKGKGKFKGKDAKGKGFKGKGKGELEVEDGPRDFAALKGGGKDNGKNSFKGKAWGKGPAFGKGAALDASTPASRAAKLLADVARQQLAADGDGELKEEDAEDAIGDDGGEEAAAEEPEAEGEAPEQEQPQEAEGAGEEALDNEDEAIEEAEEKEEDEDENLVPKDTTRGSYLGLLFSGGLLGAKRPGAPLAGEAKRAR